jgi:Predicted membrane protein (DUF2085)
VSGARRSQVLRAGLTVAALGWAVLIVVAPAWAGHGTGVDRDPRATVAALVRVVGARVCHQRPDRTFHLSGRPMPVCGRCAGLYMSGALGLLAVAIGGRPRQPVQGGQMPAWYPDRLDPRAVRLIIAAVPTAATWLSEVAGFWNPGTPLRALAALPLGLTAGWLMGRTLDR